MSGIVCAVRGGVFSQKTIHQAIKFSKEKQQKVYFLYVVNLDFLSNALHANLPVMEEEMREMGEFILLAATSQAMTAGVEAETVVKKGIVGEQIIEVCKEINADYVILGSPQTGQQGNLIESDAIKEFAKKIEDASNAKVIYVNGIEGEEV